jgi:hypothetical protein
MNKLLIAVILGCSLAILVESFLTPTYKNGCDPNPCKNKGSCKLHDPKNKDVYTCTCDNDHHGKNCEHKTGCSKKPCKHKATCTNHPLNKTDYNCKCVDNYVGKDCDKKNVCETKNPCKNGGKCVIDKKGDQHCDCKPGWGSKACDKQVCNITEISIKSHTKKSAKLFLDASIKDKVKQLDDLAKLCKVHLHCSKSHVQHPDKSKAYTYDIKDKTNPNFYIGQAISCHIYDTKDHLMCNDVCLGKAVIPVAEAKCFIDGLYALKWKHSLLDPGTFHTDYYQNHLVSYNKQREAIQVGCAGKKFT